MSGYITIIRAHAVAYIRMRENANYQQPTINIQLSTSIRGVWGELLEKTARNFVKNPVEMWKNMLKTCEKLICRKKLSGATNTGQLKRTQRITSHSSPYGGCMLTTMREQGAEVVPTGDGGFVIAPGKSTSVANVSKLNTERR